MKKNVIIFIAVLLLVSLTACAGSSPVNTADNSSTAGTNSSAEPAVAEQSAASAVSEAAESPSATSASDESEPDETPDSQAAEPLLEHKSVLVVVFSATGTTKSVAEKIAAIEDADLYEIKAKQEYTSADLNWNDRNSRSTKEQNDSNARPEIGSSRISFEGYEKIYIGFPIWWGEEPRIMDTFVESYDFGGITMIPFCTSSSSGIGRSGRNLADNAKSGSWLEGKRFPGSVSESALRSWIDGLK